MSEAVKTDLRRVTDEALYQEVMRRHRGEALHQVSRWRALFEPDDEDVDMYGASDQSIEDPFALDEARVRFARREVRETLFNLEKALGREFSGLADLTPEQLQ